MKKFSMVMALIWTLSIPIMSQAQAQEKKAKADKVTGDVGLLDLEKKYMIVVTKEGKLVTVDFDEKTKVTKFMPEKSKMSDVGLGQAASVNYTVKGEKKVIESLEFKVKEKKGE